MREKEEEIQEKKKMEKRVRNLIGMK